MSSPVPAGRALHGRKASETTATRVEPKQSKKSPSQPEVHFTTLIRLPFDRGDFVDPPQVQWDAAKDKSLWKVISRSSTTDLNWEDLATKLDVPQPFLLQQAAWLYERHLSHVRAQMRKVNPINPPAGVLGSGSISAASPVGPPGKPAPGSRAPSALSVRTRDIGQAEWSGPGTPRPAAPSRHPSTSTVTESRQFVPASPRQPVRQLRGSFGAGRRPDIALSSRTAAAHAQNRSPPRSPSLSSSLSSTSSSDDEAPPQRSQFLRRPPRFKPNKAPLSTLDSDGEGDADSDSEDSLPFAAAAATGGDRTRSKIPDVRPADLGATVRETRSQAPSLSSSATEPSSSPARTTAKGKARIPNIDSSTASTSSASSAPGPSGTNPPASQPPGPLSPRHRANLARLNRKDRHSDGTPSMGSSFSDLDGEFPSSPSASSIPAVPNGPSTGPLAQALLLSSQATAVKNVTRKNATRLTKMWN
ncbi:hypothetical protein P152DRAFT_460986 [Eremomyces bilateralis CBS 781.70]|uniref:Autophagy-related protein 29 n=1 Tax=Eremomyces bilateralis CBS 781.70 TaxID=1392243 RepID=A0A6G1FVT0_9PEZI|nr:uncharacterized protein P152DRAFT_460986 [Eremomyces bilateralis CBS 781.70]KAF1809894.1 hypothetical protein P152DRAFT_460986 [Eremomyces bilateralis CBS 781.70]